MRMLGCACAYMQAIYPTEYEGVKLVSFGYAGQGSAIMRGPMVSGLIQQMLTTTEWGGCLPAGERVRCVLNACCRH